MNTQSNFNFTVLLTGNDLLVKNEKKERKYKEDDLYNSFTTLLKPTNIIYIFPNPILGKDINNLGKTKDDIYNLFINTKEKSDYYEFNEVYSLELNKMTEIFDNNFKGFNSDRPIPHILYIFTGNDEKENCKIFNESLFEFFKYFQLKNGYSNSIDVIINSLLIYNENYENILNEEKINIQNISNKLKEMINKADNFITKRLYEYKDINIINAFQIGNLFEVSFVKSNNIYLNRNVNNNNLSSISIDTFFNDMFNAKDEKIKNNFQLEEFDKINIFSIINPTDIKNYSNNAIQLIVFKNFFKETSSLKLKNSINLNLFDSVRSLNSSEIGNLKSSVVKNSNNNLGNSLLYNNNNTSNLIGNVNDTIFDLTISMNENPSQINNNNLNTTNAKNTSTFNNKNDINNNSNINNENIMHYLKNIANLISDNKNDNEKKIKELEDKLEKANNEKNELDKQLKIIKKDYQMLEEEKYSLERQNKQKENYCTSLENKVKELNQNIEEKNISIKDKDSLIDKLQKDNIEKDKKINKYAKEYTEIKNNNEKLNKLFDEIQNKFNSLVLNQNNND